MAPQPAITDKCAGCHHAFGWHYVTFSGGGTGCGYVAQEQRDSNCSGCKGFLIIYKPSPVETTPEGHRFAQQWDR